MKGRNGIGGDSDLIGTAWVNEERQDALAASASGDLSVTK